MPDNLPTHRLAPSAGAHGNGRCKACGSKVWSSAGACSNSSCAVHCCSECGGIVRGALLCLDCLAVEVLDAACEALAELTPAEWEEFNLYADSGCTPEETMAAIRADRRAN
jgi:hypothetical protein